MVYTCLQPRGSSHHSSGHSHESSKAAKGHHDSHHVVPESPIVVHGADAALKERRPSRVGRGVAAMSVANIVILRLTLATRF